MQLKIEEIFAFVAENEDGEGVMAMTLSNGMMMPLVGADMSRVKSLLPIAFKISETTGKDFRVLKFSKREDITDEVKRREYGAN